jgi:TolB-like protein/tetratricopeptide (TPR) repeat protein
MAADVEPDSRLKIAHVLNMDIVGYSTLLITEQSQVMSELTRIVRGSARFRQGEAEGKLLRIPTGDGMALVFFTDPEAPIECAMEIAAALKNHPEIRLRMGIHSGPVNQVVDVNDRSNVAGAGIDMAQRVMDCGDAGHILLSKRVADDLAPHPRWNPHLHDLGECEVKHGRKVGLVNFYTDELGNPTVPEKLKGASRQPAAAPAQAEWPYLIKIATLLLACLLAVIAVIILLHDRGTYLPSAQTLTSPALVRVTPSAEKSIAVLPFVDLSQAKDQEYFCDGISEEILDALAKVEGLRVVARTSSFSFKGKNADVAEIAQKLNVQNVLEGSLRREGNRIRITAQLINAGNGFHIWSDTFERELQSIFAVQDQITRAIVEALKVKLAVAPPARPRPDTEAHDLYLQGLFFSNKSSEEALRKSLDFFQRALQKDPNYAKAWTGTAKAWEWLADAYVKPLEAYPAMRAAASKAIELDETEAEAHCYLGDSKRVLDWDVAGGEAEFKRALQLDPNSGTAHFFLALSLSSQGEAASAQAQMKEAVKLDPLSPIIGSFAGMIDLAYGRFDDAIAEGRRTQLLDPNYFYQGSELATAYREKGMFAEALELYKKAGEVTGVPQPGLAITYAKMGRRNEAERVFDEVKTFAATHYVAGEAIASICVALKDNDSAFQWLERAYQEHSGSLQGIAVRPEFRPLYSDPRLADLLKRIGLDPAKVLAAAKRF